MLPVRWGGDKHLLQAQSGCGNGAGETAPRGGEGEQGQVALEPLCPNLVDSSGPLTWAQAPETPVSGPCGGSLNRMCAQQVTLPRRLTQKQQRLFSTFKSKSLC